MRTRAALYGLGAAALMAVLGIAGGCGSGGAEGGDSETEHLKAQVRTLSDENIDLKRQVFQANHKVAIEQDAASTLKNDLKKLQKEHTNLQRDYEELAADSQTASEKGKKEREAKAPEKAAAAVTKTPAEAPEDPEPTDAEGSRVKELTTQQTDLEAKIAKVQTAIGTGQAKISSLARATIDKNMEVPPGGKIENGQVYRRDPCPHPWTDGRYIRRGCPYCPHYAAIGPAVIPGDFKTTYDRSQAINAVRTELAPLHAELRSLKDQLDKVKAELVALRKKEASPAPATPPASDPAAAPGAGE
jgi:DNA repair exonuclease SbcCD ATPase subunit